MKNIKIKKAFTLAETLLTLFVIGVVVILVMCVFISNTNQIITDTQKKVFTKKLNDSLNSMKIVGDMEHPYNSTSEFLSTFKKHINISEICDIDNLQDCFSEKFIYVEDENDGVKTIKEYDVSQLNTTKLPSVAFNKSKLMGVRLGDGTGMLVAYKPDCTVKNNDNPQKCLGYIADVNGKSGKNSTSSDIVSNHLLNGGLFTPKAYTPSECEIAKSKGAPISNCGWSTDYWAAAVYKCHQKGMRLPTPEELQALAQDLYQKDVPLYGGDGTVSIKNKELWEQLGGANLTIHSNKEHNRQHCADRIFRSNWTYSYGSNYGSTSNRHSSLERYYCVPK